MQWLCWAAVLLSVSLAAPGRFSWSYSPDMQLCSIWTARVCSVPLFSYQHLALLNGCVWEQVASTFLIWSSTLPAFAKWCSCGKQMKQGCKNMFVAVVDVALSKGLQHQDLYRKHLNRTYMSHESVSDHRTDWVAVEICPSLSDLDYTLGDVFQI